MKLTYSCMHYLLYLIILLIIDINIMIFYSEAKNWILFLTSKFMSLLFGMAIIMWIYNITPRIQLNNGEITFEIKNTVDSTIVNSKEIYDNKK